MFDRLFVFFTEQLFIKADLGENDFIIFKHIELKLSLTHREVD
jgi:hypothetical protein